MKKTLLLFLLLPFFGFAQTDLVRWNAATSSRYTPAVVANVTPLDITTNGGVNITYISNNSESTFFQTGNWPVPQQIGSAYDVNKYIQFRIKPADKYKIDVNTFTFQCRSGSGKFKVRYSKNANFETGVKDLILETTTPGNWTTYTTTLSPDFNPVLENEYIYIRIYSYSTNNTFEIKTGTLATNVIPVINGSVSPYDSSKIMAVKDFTDTKINVAANINLLANDIQKQNVTTLTLSTPPNALEGTAIINPDKSITFNPAKDFVGTSTFSYTISNGTETSTSTVKVTVSNNPDNVLSLWNGAGDSFNPVTNSYVNPNSPVTSVGATLKYTFYNTDNAFFETGNWPRPNQNGGMEDLGKYVQFKINPDSKHKLTLKQFNFTYRANGQRFLVKYSKDPNFTAGVLTMIPDTPTASNWTSLTNNINPSVNPILPNETLYIRIYSYSSNNNFEIKNGNGNSEGPVITGTVDDVYTLTANNDYVSTPSNKPIEIDVLANDVVGSTYPLNSISFTQPSNGTVTIDATNKITFTPNANFTGSATFTYTLRNTNSPSDYSSATVIVNATAPVCTTPGDQTTFGSDAWIGYVYKMADNAAMPPNVSYPALPNTTIATYIGTVTENKNFDRNVGDGAVSGATTNIPCVTAPAERFFVRYKMLATITEAGVYSFDLGSDDGVRLYIDDVATPVISRWNGHGYTADYVSQNLSVGTHKFVLEYYEDGGASRVSFFYGLPKGNPTEYGNKVWNVYGYVNNDITLNNVRYAGYYVDPNLSPDSANFWSRDKSPSSATIWQGSQIPDNNFTVVYKRKGFDCGLYQLRHVNHDDAYELYIDDVLIASQNGWNNASFLINNGQLYPLNNNSRVEIRLREDGGDANLAINFTKTDVIYNGTGTIPSGGSVVINNNTVLSTDLTVCSCTINPNITLTVPKDVTLTVDENITVIGSGKLLILDGGSLLQTSTSKDLFTGGTNTFEAQRTINVVRYDVTYWSSPVGNFTMHDLSPETLYDKYHYWNPATNKWLYSINGIEKMEAGKGYSIRAPQPYDLTTPADFTAKFIGKPNNGDIPISLVSGNLNLLGNPYPSSLDAEKFITDNGDIGPLYFWSHNTPPKKIEGTNTYSYDSADFAVFTLTGQTQPSPKGQVPNGYIATGQGFFVQPKVSSVLFTNSQRIKANNNAFFKTTEKTSGIEKNRLWLNLTNTGDAFKQILIGYATGATNGLDHNYDATTMNSNSYVDFYSINESKRLTVQGRALPFDNTDTVPLGYKSTIEGELTISIDHADGFFDTQEIYLEDKLTGKIIDLRKENYTFKTAIGTSTTRFILRYTNKTLGTDDFENIGNSVLVAVKSKVINLTSGIENIKEVQIYTIGGQTLYSKNKIEAKELRIENLHSSNQVLLVKVILENGHTVTKKIIFN
ncbi:Ig-like domain-containing protein [Flavobacterium sp. DG2-3]|uniref:Ig-like domain-containing protein n=1 Tax=Flavobacterium sp. DG2-3 TaxID=3068317 RepID=UPI00273EC653|nr:Ig-like domain-containing protein [Flavobacterium sp. DG2-3]MDP5198214.1 Ig-like domain-containing protein [Flavobacterium sp. DG2-3]